MQHLSINENFIMHPSQSSILWIDTLVQCIYWDVGKDGDGGEDERDDDVEEQNIAACKHIMDTKHLLQHMNMSVSRLKNFIVDMPLMRGFLDEYQQIEM